MCCSKLSCGQRKRGLSSRGPSGREWYRSTFTASTGKRLFWSQLGAWATRCWTWYVRCNLNGTITDIILLDFRTNKPSDIISTLVSIYDSQDLFIKELQVLLAQRLLAIKDGNFDKEVCSFLIKHCPKAPSWNMCVAPQHRILENSFRRSPTPSMWSHVTRHDRFQANRSAYSSAE